MTCKVGRSVGREASAKKKIRQTGRQVGGGGRSIVLRPMKLELLFFPGERASEQLIPPSLSFSRLIYAARRQQQSSEKRERASEHVFRQPVVSIENRQTDRLILFK